MISQFGGNLGLTGRAAYQTGHDKITLIYRAQLFEGRLALNPGLKLTPVSFSCVQKHFLR